MASRYPPPGASALEDAFTAAFGGLAPATRHTSDVLGELGYPPAEIARLRAGGMI